MAADIAAARNHQVDATVALNSLIDVLNKALAEGVKIEFQLGFDTVANKNTIGTVKTWLLISNDGPGVN